MRAVHKVELLPGPLNQIMFDPEAQILSVHEQNDKIQMWFLTPVPRVETHGDVQRSFIVVGTGWKIDLAPNWKIKQFIGTVHMEEGMLVFHVFEVEA